MIKFSIPLPPISCSSNARGSWRRHAKHIKAYREISMVKCLQALGQMKGNVKPVVISTTWYMGPTYDPRYRPLDSTNANAALKAAIDGFVDAGLVPNDSYKFVSLMPPTLFRSKKEHEGKAEIIVEVREAA